MKYTAPFVLAALLGFSEVEVNALAIRKHHYEPEYIQESSEDDDEDSSSDLALESESDDDSSSSDVQVGGGDDDEKKPEDPYPAWMHGFGGYHTYMRDVPDRFEGAGDDKLMESLYKNYAFEGRKNGLPDGHFWLDEANAKAVSTEVVGTHLGLKGGELNNYIKNNFPAVWQRFDVNEEGKVEIDRMPQFLRMICGNAEACLGL